MIKVHVFHTGSVVVDSAIPYKEKNPLAVTGFLRSKKNKITLPVSCYLIEHPKGNVLIDTGWHSKYVTEKPHRFFGLLDKISTPVIKEGQSVDKKLADLGFAASDLDYVVFSHLDFDHTSGLELVQDAKCIMASDAEIKDADKYFFRYVKNNWNFANISVFSFEDTGIGPVGKSYDLFNDGTLLLVNTPGHSHGHTSAVVKNDENFIVIAGDCAYTHASWQEMRLPGFTVNKKLAEKSLEWIKETAQNEKCVAVLANHDFEIKEQTITI
ncbi:MAG: N-acyl homoserine lactonase family protein [Candidatus Scatosoma sp.]